MLVTRPACQSADVAAPKYKRGVSAWLVRLDAEDGKRLVELAIRRGSRSLAGSAEDLLSEALRREIPDPETPEQLTSA
jgi:hypothetical protein